MTHGKTDLVALLALMGLLALTVVLSMLPLGSAGPAAALTISAAKAVIIAGVFMELRAQSGPVRLFALAGLLWLGILIALTLADFLTRG